MKTKSSYLFEDRGTDGIDLWMYSKTFQMIYGTPTKAEN